MAPTMAPTMTLAMLADAFMPSLSDRRMQPARGIDTH